MEEVDLKFFTIEADSGVKAEENLAALGTMLKRTLMESALATEITDHPGFNRRDARRWQTSSTTSMTNV